MELLQRQRQRHPFVNLLCQLQDELQGSTPKQLAANPRSIKELVDKTTDRFIGYEQRDAHEFLMFALDLLDKEIKVAKQNDVDEASGCFTWKQKAKLECIRCGYCRYVL